MFTNYSNMNMLNIKGMLGANNCATNFFAGGCNNMLSIFGFGNNGFYNPCDGTYDYDAMAGWGVASTLANIGLSILGQHIESKKAEKAQPSLGEQIADIDEQIQEQADKIGVKADEVATYDISKSEFQAKVADATQKHTEATNAYTKAQTTTQEKARALGELEQQYDVLNAKTNRTTEEETQLATLKGQVEAAKTAKKQAEETEAEAQKAVEAAKTAKEQAEKDLEAHETTVKEVQAEVAKLQDKKAALEKQKGEQDFANAAKKADGNIFTRDLNFDIDKFNPNDTELSQPQLKALIAGFTNKKATEADKKKYAEKLASLTQTQLSSIKADKNQEFVWKAAKEYCATNN